jgi:autotransporter-associated beta strand protein
MSTSLLITRGDTAPLRVRCERENDAGVWTEPDFTGATPKLIIKADDGTWTMARTGTFTGAVAVVAQAATDFPGTGVTQAWATVEVTYADTTRETFPRGPGRLSVVIDDGDDG